MSQDWQSVQNIAFKLYRVKAHPEHADSEPTTSESVEEYQYEPIRPDQIRILELWPGNPSDALYGRLRSVSVSDNPGYYAISYAWGEPILSHTINLSGRSLGITPSLYGALCRLRQQRRRVAFWADAICINQNDTEEKSHQVHSMAQIFARAKKVCIWLGDDGSGNCKIAWACDLLGKIHEDEDELPRIGEVERSLRVANDMLNKVGHTPCQRCGTTFSATEHSVNWLLKLLNVLWGKPWFSRLWVIQEAASALEKTFFLGKHEIRFEAISIAIKYQYYLNRHLVASSQLDRAERARLIRVNDLIVMIEDARPSVYLHAPTLIGTLIHSRAFIASDVRDRVFATQTLANIQGVAELQPDYHIAPAELWLRVATYCIAKESDHLANPGSYQRFPAVILALAGLPPKRSSGVSWVTDFSLLTDNSRRKFKFYMEQGTKHKAGGPPEYNVLEIQGPILRHRGIVHGSIQEICPGSQFRPPNSEEHDSETASNRFLQVVASFLVPWYLSCATFAQMHTIDHLAQTLDMRKLLLHGSTRVETPAAWSLNEFLAHLRGQYWLLDGIYCDPNQIYEDLRPFLTGLHAALELDSTRVLASTSDGRIGWVPESSKAGDAICLLKGAPFPFVLRDRGGGSYELQGDAYVQGIENGEAWPPDESNIMTLTIE